MSIKEESHTLREWQKILANNPELMAEFEELTPPTPIKGDISEQHAEKQDYSALTDLERAILRGFLAAGAENVSATIIKETAKECLSQMKHAERSEGQPVEGLEEEIERYCDKLHAIDIKSEPFNSLERCARHFAAWQKGNIKNLLKSWAENELDEHPNKNDDFRLAIYSLMDKLNDL